MSLIQETPKMRGKPREETTYRRYRRANAVKWDGVEPSFVVEHPPLKRDARGNVNFSKKKRSEE